VREMDGLHDLSFRKEHEWERRRSSGDAHRGFHGGSAPRVLVGACVSLPHMHAHLPAYAVKTPLALATEAVNAAGKALWDMRGISVQEVKFEVGGPLVEVHTLFGPETSGPRKVTSLFPGWPLLIQLRHTWRSIEVAFRRTKCGQVGAISSRERLNDILARPAHFGYY